MVVGGHEGADHLHIELKDSQTGETFRVDENGTTLGRDKARAATVVPDAGVSGLHARISLNDDKWWIEDLKSSNGTFVDGEKLKPNTPTQLSRGTKFKFHSYGYEVSDIDPDGEGASTAIFNQATQVGHKAESTIENHTIQEEASAPVKSGPVKSAPVATGPSAFAEKSGPVKADKSKPKSGDGASLKKSGSLESAAPGGTFGSEIGKAFAYYLAALPLFLFGFKGRVDSAINDQKIAPMEKMTLAAWAVPPNVLGSLIGSLVGLLAMIVGGNLAIVGWVISLAIGLAIAVVVSIITGFIFHPLMNWIITKLKGKSDAKSRTNYLVSTMTAVGLQQIISGVAGLFGLLVFIPYVGAFLGIIPILLSAVATAISLYVAYKWFEYFGVVKWFLKVILVLGALALLGVLFGAIGVITRGISGLSGGGTVSVGGTNVAGVDNEEVKKQIEEAKANAEKAIADAKANAKGAKEEGAKTDPKADAKAAKEEAKAAAAAAKEEAKAAAAAAKEEAAKEAKDAKEAKAGAAKEEVKASKGSREDYETYAAKRDAIEKAIEKNPTLLTRTEGVLNLYKAMHKDIKAVNEKYKKTKGDPVSERLKEAETYERTVEAVTELHKKLIEK